MRVAMKADVAKRWAEFLQELAQDSRIIRLTLKRENAFCVIGALCEVFREAHADDWVWIKRPYTYGDDSDLVRVDGTYGPYSHPMGYNGYRLPGAVACWAEISVRPQLKRRPGPSLAYLHDSESVSLGTIIQDIEDMQVF